jgi:hypothetical protein
MRGHGHGERIGDLLADDLVEVSFHKRRVYLLLSLLNPETETGRPGSCDAPSQPGVGDALVASCSGVAATDKKVRRGCRNHPTATGRRRYFHLAASEFGLNLVGIGPVPART